jgi:hypothetical protein
VAIWVVVNVFVQLTPTVRLVTLVSRATVKKVVSRIANV